MDGLVSKMGNLIGRIIEVPVTVNVLSSRIHELFRLLKHFMKRLSRFFIPDVRIE